MSIRILIMGLPSVGYTIEEERFDEAVTQISGTEIRKQLGLK